jgi:glycosyltransferase involved in cell wall biosynthesis
MKDAVIEYLRSENTISKVHFFDSRSDISEIMQCGDLFMLPSLFEGLGIVAIEAQAAGLPCILSDNVPNEANCGKCMFLPLDDETLWLNAMDNIIYGGKDLKIQEDKLQKFSIEYMVSQMVNVFETETL